MGLVDPFYYPDAKEDMTLEERKTREEWIENTFQKTRSQQQSEEMRNKAHNTALRSMGLPFGRGTGREKILKSLAERKNARERLIANAMAGMPEEATPPDDSRPST